MKKLKDIWKDIQPEVKSGHNSKECVATGFLFPWSSDNANIDMICKALFILEPKVFIELGTFEGFGLMNFAQTLSLIGGEKKRVYTFDAGKAPYDTLGEVYGVTSDLRDEKNLVKWENMPSHSHWRSWEKVIAKRNERLTKEYPGVEVEYIEGLTFDSLPKFFRKNKGLKWDFLYQDTVHTLDLILKEWSCYFERSKIGSIIVFDNIPLKMNQNGKVIVDYFMDNYPNWEWFHAPVGSEQLWGQRLK